MRKEQEDLKIRICCFSHEKNSKALKKKKTFESEAEKEKVSS